MRVYLDSVGCRLNQAEIEIMARQFRAAGHEIVESAAVADLAVLNTCTVTSAAAADSRGLIRRAAREVRGRVAATGCWVTLHRSEMVTMPAVQWAIPNGAKESLVSRVLGTSPEAVVSRRGQRQPIVGPRHRTRAFIKAQDGCNNHCTFCVTTVARGGSRSREAREVIAEVRSAVESGAKEAVLTGVHLGSWGIEKGLHLKDLVRAILQASDVPRLRLSSLEPWDLDASFFELWEDARLCRHLHLPLQSGSAATLKRMARKTTPSQFQDLVSAARSLIPDVAITTDVIAGFPGEVASEFEESLEFVLRMDFAGGHAFTYSPMMGTAAARMTGQIPLKERQLRARRCMRLFERAAVAFRQRQIGKRGRVLWESATRNDDSTWQLGGLTDNYIRVRAQATGSRWNMLDDVLLAQEGARAVLGIICE